MGDLRCGDSGDVDNGLGAEEKAGASIDTCTLDVVVVVVGEGSVCQKCSKDLNTASVPSRWRG